MVILVCEAAIDRFIIRLGLRLQGLLMIQIKKFYENICGRWKNRVKIFAWRACKDSLPTAHKLQQKLVIVEDKCSFYNSEVKSLTHALINCEMIRGVWGNYFSRFIIERCDTVMEMALWLCQRKESNKLNAFLWFFGVFRLEETNMFMSRLS